ncbi:MAG: TolC family protein [Bacteroidales bacterium]|jgi:hypothetical protein|nr:TolC family protein [Bacteroidales bacterium]
MGKKIFAVLLLLSFACAGLQAQNNQKKEKDRTTDRVKKDIEIMHYNPIRTNSSGSDSASISQVMQELAIKDQGVSSVATIIANYKPFILPPLDELFERAKNNPSVVLRQHEMDFAWRDVMAARREWMKWVRGSAAYSYGKYNTNLFYQQTNIPTADTYSSQNASYYLLGASVQINLFDIYNYNNNIQQKRDQYQKIEYSFQAAWSDAMEKISTSYYTLVYLLPIVSHGIQWAKLAELSYEDTKLDFIAGRAKTYSLYEVESQYYRAVQELTVNLKEISINVKYLELATNSKIVPDEVPYADDKTIQSPNSTNISYPVNVSQGKSSKPLSKSEKRALKKASKDKNKTK